MKWLITGGCGFIGTNVVKRLIDEGGQQIRIVDNLSVGTAEDLGGVCEFEPAAITEGSGFSLPKPDVPQLVEADILDEAVAVAAGSDMDVVVHLAANTGVAPSVEDPRTDCITNVVGTLNYLEASRRSSVRRFIFASSGAPVGEVEPPIHEEVVPHPVSPYGASKLAGEAYCSAYFRTYALETVVLRFSNVYGPGSTHKSSVVAKFIRHALNGEPLPIYGDGNQTRDFIHVDDLGRAIRLGAEKPGIGGEIFQIATNKETSITELSERVSELVSELRGTRPDVVRGEFRAGDVMRNYSDTSKARQVLGWTNNVSLEQGLRATFDWFVDLT